ncbi:MAG: ORF6N domain-containing protein [Elusimicrobiota bacterium]
MAGNLPKQCLPIVSSSLEQKIFLIRGKRVMLDYDLSELYGVPTKRLNEQVRRNPQRFPERYMFQLSWGETKSLRSQNATLKKGQNIKYRPYAFTEHGVSMLSAVLNSEQAIKVSVLIIDTFVKLREMLSNQKEVMLKLEEMERRIEGHDEGIKTLFDALRQLLAVPAKRMRKIGFKK